MIPFVDLQSQYRSIKPEIDEAVLEVLGSSQYVLGRYVADFEQAFAAYVDTPEAVACSSGTSALHLALLAAGVGPGDEVITVPMTFVATVAAVCYTGATPVFVDVDPTTWTMDPDGLAGALSERTKAVLPVHLHGLCADMDPIIEFCRQHGLILIEDAAQAHGATYKGRPAGSLSDIGCFSFYPGKNLGAYGEGGAAVTANPEFAEAMRMYRDWGQTEKYNHVVKGFNYRMDGIQGAVLSVKLRHIESWNDERRQAAAWYDHALADVDVVRPAPPAERRHVYHVYALRVRDRQSMIEALSAAEIASAIHYPVPVHLQRCHADLGYKRGDFPVSESLADEFLSIPIYPGMTEEVVEKVAATVRQSAPLPAAFAL